MRLNFIATRDSFYSRLSSFTDFQVNQKIHAKIVVLPVKEKSVIEWKLQTIRLAIKKI